MEETWKKDITHLIVLEHSKISCHVISFINIVFGQIELKLIQL